MSNSLVEQAPQPADWWPRWLKDGRGPYVRFLEALDRPRLSQERILLRQVKCSASSVFGREHRFSAVRSIANFQQEVPVASYKDIEPWIERVLQGESGVLTSEPVLMLQRTSGSTASVKYIPYTKGLLREFRNAVSPWLFDVYAHRPHLLDTKAYWSISPGMPGETTENGLPLGFASDAEYLARGAQRAITKGLAVPPEVALIEDAEAFRYVTLRFLLESRDLGLFSVWSPSFLLVLLNDLATHANRLVEDVKRGTITPPTGLSPALADALDGRLGRTKGRGDEIVRAFTERGSLDPQVIWPKLSFLSCWTGGASSAFAFNLAAMLPGVEVQGKGLLATEGVVSIPLTAYGGCVLTPNAHFYEFEDIVSPGTSLLIMDELQVGRDYAVIVTTSGGLYRYKLNDVVRVVGRVGRTPMVEFVGRAGIVSDLCGEKLDEAWVSSQVNAVLGSVGLAPKFAMVAPEVDGSSRYVIFIEAPELSDAGLQNIAGLVESRLLESFGYAQARRLNQLAPVQPFRVTSGGVDVFMGVSADAGTKLGAVKQRALDPHTGWSRRFSGYAIPGNPHYPATRQR